MILSLEEDEEEIYDLQDVTQNVITLGKKVKPPKNRTSLVAVYDRSR